MKEIFTELARNPIGRVLQKAMIAIGNDEAKAEPLFKMQEQIVPRLRSRQVEFTPIDEALSVYDAQQSTPHVTSLARSHSWYAPALPKDFKAQEGFNFDDMLDEGAKQLKLRQGITAQVGQFNIAGVSTMALGRAIIRTSKPDGIVLGDTVAWDGYSLAPALEGRGFQTKPDGMGWNEYISQNFTNPKEQLGAIFITSPCSITGKLCDADDLRDLLDISDKYNVKVVINQVHATPDRKGNLPEPQTGILANARNKNLVVMASTTKHMMTYAIPGLEKQTLNVFYSPNAPFIDHISREVEKASTVPENKMMVAPEAIGPAVEMMRASGKDFYAGNQQASYARRLIIDNWLFDHKDISWYHGHMPETGYHSSLTLKGDLLAKSGIKNPHQLYDYILFSTGLDFAPVFDAGPNETKNANGDISLRLNYSLPEKELRLTLDLLGVAAKKLEQGVTLDEITALSRRQHHIKLKADETPAAAPNAVAVSAAPLKPV